VFYDGPVVSPKRAPEPHHPDQMTAFETPVDTTYAAAGSPMAVSIIVSFHRMPRQKCSSCANRRICYYVGLGDIIQSPPLCAKCAGIR
jgi:hypothetical protein